MAIDLRRVLQAAFEAATQQTPPQNQPKPKKPHLSVGKGLLLGAGVVTAGRLLAGSKGQELFGSLQQRLEEYVEEPQGEDEEDFEDEDEFEEPQGEDEEDFEDEGEFEEPQGEDEEDFEDEEEFEDPEGEDEEDFEDEEEFEEPEGEDEEDFEDEDDDEERPRVRRRPRSRERSRA